MLLTVLGKIRAGWAKAGSTATAVAKEVRATVSKGLAEIPSKGDVVPIAKDAVRVGGAKAMGAAMSVSTAMKEGGARVGTLVTRVQSTGEDVLPITMDAFRMGVTKGTAAVTTVATAAKGGGARLGMLMTQLQSTGEDVLPITMDAFRVGVAKGTAAVTTVATAAKGGGARLGMLMTQLLSTAPAGLMTPREPPILTVLGKGLVVATGAGIAITLVPAALSAFGLVDGGVITGTKMATMISTMTSGGGGGVPFGDLVEPMSSAASGLASVESAVAGFTGIPYLGTGLVLVAGAGAAVTMVPVALGVLGFTGSGISAGSMAASMMSSAAIANGGGVPAGSLVAMLQSIGAAGLSTTGTVAVGGVGSSLSGVGWVLYNTVMSQV